MSRATSPTQQSQSRVKCVPYPGRALLPEGVMAGGCTGRRDTGTVPESCTEHSAWETAGAKLQLPKEPEGLSGSQWPQGPPQGQGAFQAGIFCEWYLR